MFRHDRISTIVSWVAGLVALAFTLTLSFGYYIIAYRSLASAVETRASIKAEILGQVISARPEMWMFEEFRLKELLTRHPIPIAGELSRVVDIRGNMVVSVGEDPKPPVLLITMPLFDSGRIVGRLEVRHSIRHVYLNTLTRALFGAGLGVMVFLTLKVVPLRALRRAIDAQREVEERHRMIVETMNEGVVLCLSDGTICSANPSTGRILGLSGLGDRKISDIFLPAIREDGLPFPVEENPVLAVLQKGKSSSGYMMGLSKPDGTQVWIMVNTQSLLQRSEPMPYAAVISFTDVTERKHLQDRVYELAFYDPLTSLPNRAMFANLLEQAILRSNRSSKPLAVLIADLDRFKNFNDTLGYEVGDYILREISSRLTQLLRKSDIVSRPGGDEFAVLIEEYGATQHVARVAEKILNAINLPFLTEGREYYVTASIGISSSPEDGEDRLTLIKNAETAMYRAKGEGGNNHRFYSAQMNLYALERLALESSLSHAIERNELLLHYQPRIDIGTGRIVSMEALLRWRHPDMGMVSPMQFIPIAEETGLIVAIGEWVLKTACVQNRRFQEMGLPPVRVAVNLSARQFYDERLMEKIMKILEESGLDGNLLEMEITESLLMRDPERAIGMMKEVKAHGMHISIDDFGTGYSSLAYLKQFPIDCLKIDRSFIKGIPEDPDDSAITRMVINMAHALNLRVIAEGVETEEQLNFLRDIGCDEFQGYLFSKPVPEDEFGALLQKTLPLL